ILTQCFAPREAAAEQGLRPQKNNPDDMRLCLAMLEFSAILSAVKPKDRTDQYSILAALYHLGAHSVPVTARQINDLLTIHLGFSAPSNVNASLRSYTSFAEVADKGHPL